MNINDRLRELLKGQPGVRHAKTRANRIDADTWQCPECHRKTRKLSMWCDGIRWFKEAGK